MACRELGVVCIGMAETACKKVRDEDREGSARSIAKDDNDNKKQH